VRLLASSVGVARMQRPYHRDALEPDLAAVFLPSGAASELTVGRAGRTKGWPRSNESDSRSVENIGLPEDTHVLASITRHRPEPRRHRTCGFVESGRSHPTRMREPCRRRRIHGQRARPLPLDLLCSRGATSAAICHAEGRGFESHQPLSERPAFAGLFRAAADRTAWAGMIASSRPLVDPVPTARPSITMGTPEPVRLR
jgi:hypothetical protein